MYILFSMSKYIMNSYYFHFKFMNTGSYLILMLTVYLFSLTLEIMSLTTVRMAFYWKCLSPQGKLPIASCSAQKSSPQISLWDEAQCGGWLPLADQPLKSMYDLLVRGDGGSRGCRAAWLALHPGSSTSRRQPWANYWIFLCLFLFKYMYIHMYM